MNLVCKGAWSFPSRVNEAVDLANGSSKAVSEEVMIFPGGGVEDSEDEVLMACR